MNETNLYEAAVGIAGLGSILLGLAGFFYQLKLQSAPDATPAGEAFGAFADARIIVMLSLVPQACLLSLPLIYPKPGDIPKSLGPAAIFVASMLLCVWGWLILKVVKAGYLRAWYARRNVLMFSAPALLTTVVIFVFAVILGRH